MDPLKVELGEHHNGIRENKSIHFLDLLDITYDADATATGFYYQYRSSVLTSLKKKGDIIAWQNNLVLPVDEELTPTFEEMILANVLGLINPLLPALVRDQYVQVITLNSSKKIRVDLASVPFINLSQICELFWATKYFYLSLRNNYGNILCRFNHFRSTLITSTLVGLTIIIHGILDSVEEPKI
jgi:hypothetical protein